MNNQIILTDDLVLEIELLSKETYKDKLPDGKTPNKLAGKTYSRFSYGNKVFTSSKEDFASAVAKGDLFKVTLEEVKEDDATYLQLVSFISYTKKNGLELNKSKLRSIQSMEFAPTVFTAELANDIA